MAKHELDDSGEIVLGARKHLFGKGLTSSDLEGLSPEEAHDLANKDKIWPQPDWTALIEEGIPADVVALMKIVRDRMPKRPNLATRHQKNRSGEDIRNDFIEMVSTIREHVESLRNADEASRLSAGIFDALGWHNEGWRDPDLRAKLDTIKRGYRYPFEIRAADRSKAARMIEEGFPASGPIPAWRKGVRIKQDSSGTFYALKGKYIVCRDQESEEDVLVALEKAWAEAKKAKAAEPKEPPPRAALKALSREGMPDWRNGEHITPDAFIETFGFRAIQFGESIPDAERQMILDHAYDGLMDLADILGASPKIISLNGHLAAAFGARGQGRFPAHYEPNKRIFNIGRMRGAGSLAHEWAHAFDHACGELGQKTASRGQVRWASEGHTQGLETLSSLAAGRWSASMKTITRRAMTKAEALQAIHEQISTAEEIHAQENRKYEQFKDDVRNRIYVSKLADWLANNRQYISRLEVKRDQLSQRDESQYFGETSTDFVKEAQKLCGKSGKYWVRPIELFARAFESAIFDELRARGATSDYLVYGVESGRFADPEDWKGNPYPVGEERENIRADVIEMARRCAQLITRDQEIEPAPSP